MIIGLCGVAGAGKTTIAKYLTENHGFNLVNFKDGLVKEMKERLPDVLEKMREYHSYATVDELFFFKPEMFRALMQNYGTEVRRKDNPDYWVDKWQETIKNTEGNIVVDDVRFFNELFAVSELGGVLIRITRPDVVNTSTHQSETEQLKFVQDFLIEAETGKHLEIYKQVEDILNIIKSNVD